MFKTGKLTFVLLAALLAGSGNYALASEGGSTTGSGTGSSPTKRTDGITGTDPEPISPAMVTVILTILNL